MERERIVHAAPLPSKAENVLAHFRQFEKRRKDGPYRDVTTTGVPTETRSNRSVMSGLYIRTQP